MNPSDSQVPLLIIAGDGRSAQTGAVAGAAGPEQARQTPFPVAGYGMPGVFCNSLCAVQDFGPFFGFTVAARTSARLIGAGLNLA